jgi:hypothetical protein
MKRALLGVLLLCLSAALRGEIRVSEYGAQKNTDEFKSYITGVGVGLKWANVLAHQGTGKWLYCQPARLSLAGANYVNMTDEAVKEWRISRTDVDDPAVELLLLLKLQEVFPCPAPPKP